MSRDNIRRSLRARRRSLTPHEHRRLCAALTRRIAGLSLFRRSRDIAFFLPNDGEPDLTALMARARRMSKRCHLPVLSPAFHNRLWFGRFTPESRLVTNRFGIPEPHIRWRDARAPWGIDLILAPLVGFDSAGNRLGMGGGFYDRTLAYRHRQESWLRPRLIGVAFDFQRVDALESAPWDVPLDGIVTEKGVYGPLRQALLSNR